MPMALAAFALKEVWNDRGDAWLAVTWAAVVPLLVYLRVNLLLRPETGVQVPLTVLAAQGAERPWRRGRRWLTLFSLALI